MKIAAGTISDSETTTIDGKSVVILAEPGAKLDRSNDGVILEIKNNGADVQIFDLEITGGTGATNPALSLPSGGAPKLMLARVKVSANQGVGISVAAGTLTLSRATVAGNQGIGISVTGGVLTMSRSIVSTNTGGGISIAGSQFDITNSFIILNGGGSSLLGGLDVSQIPNSAGTYRLDFNTISANLAQPTIPVNTGVNCATIGKSLIFNSNIIYGNVVNGGGQQLGGSPLCAASFSDVGPDPAPGVTNINMPPMFANAAQGNYHLTSLSPAKDAADPAATLLDDIDGDIRPQGPRPDMGADEFTP